MVNRTGSKRRGGSASRVGLVIGSLGLLASACTPASRATSESGPAPSSQPSSTRWVDSVLASMSPRDKAAQLVWPQVFGDFAPTSTAGWTRVQSLIQNDHVGGFIVSIGSPID